MATKLSLRVQNKITDLVKLHKTCRRMIADSKAAIIKQGGGCNVPGYGAAYKYQNKSDALAILLNQSDVRSRWYQTIDSEELRPMVRMIAARYNANITTPELRSAFVEFLRNVQDAHDAAFDEYNNREVNDTMALFVYKMDVIDQLLISEIEKNSNAK